MSGKRRTIKKSVGTPSVGRGVIRAAVREVVSTRGGIDPVKVVFAEEHAKSGAVASAGSRTRKASRSKAIGRKTSRARSATRWSVLRPD